MRLQHEVKQLELRRREKDNDYRMLILKIKELKRTFQGNYIRGVGSNSNSKPK